METPMYGRTASLQLVGDSMRRLLSNSGSPIDPMILALAAERASLLYGSYIWDNAGDPDIFIRNATEILAGYPIDVIRDVTGLAGIRSQEQFRRNPPNGGQLQAACEDMMRPRRNAAAYEQRTAEQFAERQRQDARERPSFDELAERAKAKGWPIGKLGARIHENPDVLVKEAAQRFRDGMPYEASPSLRQALARQEAHT